MVKLIKARRVIQYHLHQKMFEDLFNTAVFYQSYFFFIDGNAQKSIP